MTEALIQLASYQRVWRDSKALLQWPVVGRVFFRSVPEASRQTVVSAQARQALERAEREKRRLTERLETSS